jgi:nucleotide-binding universal stress UspA family protein
MKGRIPLDGSKFAESILSHAAKLAAQSRAEVHLLTVVTEAKDRITLKQSYTPESASFRGVDPMGIMRPTVLTSRLPFGVVESKDSALERAVYYFEDYLSGLSSKFPGLTVKSHVTLGENVADKIIGCARENKIDLIVLASHGRTGLAHVVMGSVASDLLRRGEFPLLLVRPDGLRKEDKQNGKAEKHPATT